jgi:hypothetical protein
MILLRHIADYYYFRPLATLRFLSQAISFELPVEPPYFQLPFFFFFSFPPAAEFFTPPPALRYFHYASTF